MKDEMSSDILSFSKENDLSGVASSSNIRTEKMTPNQQEELNFHSFPACQVTAELSEGQTQNKTHETLKMLWFCFPKYLFCLWMGGKAAEKSIPIVYMKQAPPTLRCNTLPNKLKWDTREHWL